MLNYRSIKGKIMMFYLFYITLFFSIFYFGGYILFSNIFMNNIFSYTKKLVEETGRNIDSYLEQINMICSSAATSQVILSHLDMMESGKGDTDENLWKVEYYLQNIVKFNSKIRDLILIDKNGHSIGASGKGVAASFNFYEQEWFPDISNEKSITFTSMHHQNYYYENYGGTNETVSAAIPVFNFLSRDRNYGAAVLCNLNIYELFDALRNIKLEKTGKIILLDQKGNSIFRENYAPEYREEIAQLRNKITAMPEVFFAIFEKKEAAVIHTRSGISGWSVIAIIPKEELVSHITPLRYIFAIIILFMIFMVAVSYSFMNSVITRPIENIISMMKKIETGNFDTIIRENSNIETGLLSSKINSLVANIVNLNRKVFMYQLQNKEAQIKALQAQINPHFLFNTLQLIKSQAVSGGDRETSQMITSLGNMLRYGIHHQEDLVPVNEEINHLRDYLGIQSRRFPSLFSCSIDCPDELMKKKTIKLILQPVVENSINHNKLSCNSISIKVQVLKTENRISITIEDNGQGIDRDRLEEIRNNINDTSRDEHGESIGLKNVHNRIHLKFGQPYGVTVFSKPGKGFRTEILIPEIPDGDFLP